MFTLKNANGDGSTTSDAYTIERFNSIEEAIHYARVEVPVEHSGWYRYVWIEDAKGNEV